MENTYSPEFKDFINRFEGKIPESEQGVFYVGGGNPAAHILFVGQEPSEDCVKYFSLHKWKKNIANNHFETWIRKRGDGGYYWKSAQCLWRNYQRLMECIRNAADYERCPGQIDFEKDVFVTDMCSLVGRRHNDVCRKEQYRQALAERKEWFFQDEFIRKQFYVVVLACGDCISGVELEKIFEVKFNQGPSKTEGSTKYWCHYSKDGRRLVIHTRNLSGGISGERLRTMGILIHEHLKSLGLSVQ